MAKLNPDGTLEFVVKGRWKFRSVACRIAQCVGIQPLAWDDDEADLGSPFWRPDASELGGGSFDLGNNDWWLRQVRTENDDGKTVIVYKLDYRYGRTEHRQAALLALGTWLECDLVFGH
jgi:hypothetical protein